MHTLLSKQHFQTQCVTNCVWFVASAIEELNKFVSEGSPSCDAILQEVRQTQLIQNITAEYKYYILMCGLFQGKRNCVKAWP